jgi:hypothetical protein
MNPPTERKMRRVLIIGTLLALSKDVSLAQTARGAKASATWAIETGRSKMDDSPTVVLSAQASNQIEGWLERYRPELIVRCREGKTTVYAVTGMPAQPEYGKFEEATVRLRLDNRAPETEVWSESTDGKALFAPDAMALIPKLATAKRLRFEFTPFNSSGVLAEFSISGLDAYIGKIAGACNWDGPSSAPLAEALALHDGAYIEAEVEQSATVRDLDQMPTCAPTMRDDERGIAQFVVDSIGRVETATYRVFGAPRVEAVEQAFRARLTSMLFVPARVGGKAVRQVVKMPMCALHPELSR